MSQLILEEHPRPGVTILTLNRPEKRNALNIPMLEALCAAVAHTSDDEAQRVLVIRAAGPVFCAGLDLEEARDPALAASSGALVRKMLEGIYTCPCVTIASVQGAALAGGAGLVAACDIAIASMDATFGYPEVRRGLVAGLVMTFLRRQVAERHARELLLLGEAISAERAAEIGLVTRAVPVEMLDEAVERQVGLVLKGAPGAIRDTKLLLDTLWHHPIAEDFDAAHEIHARMRLSEEAKEGMAAFMEKRKPRWEL
jgi:methylglutaconyl-CoA hydratase